MQFSYRNIIFLMTQDNIRNQQAEEEGINAVPEIEYVIKQRLERWANNYEAVINKRMDIYESAIDARIDEYKRALDARIDTRLERLEVRNDERLAEGSAELSQQIDWLRRDWEAHFGQHQQRVSIKDDGLENPRQNIKKQIISNVAAADADEQPFLERLIAWKKVASDNLNEFTTDEQEIADYIMGFVGSPDEAEYATVHMRRFVSLIQYIPHTSQPTARALDIGSFLPFAPAIKRFRGYSEIQCTEFGDLLESSVEYVVRQQQGTETHTFSGCLFDAERTTFPYSDGYFQLALCCEVIEHLNHDPMHLLWECNRVLAPGGYLLLTTPNITCIRAIEGVLTGYTPYLMSQFNIAHPPGQHHREYAPREIDFALRTAGFNIVKLETEDVWLRSNPNTISLLQQLGLSCELRGDNIFALARKVCVPTERYPKELYSARI